MPADHLMSFADAKKPERHFQGKITPATGKSGTVRCFHSGYTLQLDDNK